MEKEKEISSRMKRLRNRQSIFERHAIPGLIIKIICKTRRLAENKENESKKDGQPRNSSWNLHWNLWEVRRRFHGKGEFTFRIDSWAGLIASWGSFYPMNRRTPSSQESLQWYTLKGRLWFYISYLCVSRSLPDIPSFSLKTYLLVSNIKYKKDDRKPRWRNL